MNNYNAVGIVEGFIEYENEEERLKAWQHLINTGLAWTLPGRFGRTAKDLIDAGICTPAQEVAG